MAEIEGIKASAKELAAMAEMGDEKALKIFERSGAIFGRGLAVLIDLLNPERIIAGSVYARSHHFLDSAMYRELKRRLWLPVWQPAGFCRLHWESESGIMLPSVRLWNKRIFISPTS